MRSRQTAGSKLSESFPQVVLSRTWQTDLHAVRRRAAPVLRSSPSGSRWSVASAHTPNKSKLLRAQRHLLQAMRRGKCAKDALCVRTSAHTGILVQNQRYQFHHSASNRGGRTSKSCNHSSPPTTTQGLPRTRHKSNFGCPWDTGLGATLSFAGSTPSEKTVTTG
jgi:hypothetical protein